MKKLSVKKWRLRHPDRNRAHKVVFISLRNKSLQKQPCFCGSSRVEAHHEDYSKPLEIEWLCKRHHVEKDKVRRKRNNEVKLEPASRNLERDEKIRKIRSEGGSVRAISSDFSLDITAVYKILKK